MQPREACSVLQGSFLELRLRGMLLSMRVLLGSVGTKDKKRQFALVKSGMAIRLYTIQLFQILLMLISLKSSFTLRASWQRKRSLYCFAMQKDRLHLVVSKPALVSVALSTGHRWYLTASVALSKTLALVFCFMHKTVSDALL